ncbi:MAG: cobalamin-dependent protein [Nitrospiraceae bacterium]
MISTQKGLEADSSLTVALIRPPSVLPFTAQNAVLEVPPIGLAYLAACLKGAGHRVNIIDAFGEAPNLITPHDEGYNTNGLDAAQIVERIPSDVDLIGITCMFSNEWIYCRRVIEAAARAFPGVPIVMGGEHPTADHDRLLRRVPEVLCCALGEGEETMVDLAAHISHGLAIDEVPGIAVRDGDGVVVRTTPRQRIRQVDEIPWPNWDTVPLDNYLDNNIGHDAYSSRSMPILGSRGCPYQCTFCSSPQMFGTKWIARDPRKVFEEIKHYYDTYGARYFEFTDLTLMIRREWILEFCKILIDEALDFQWSMPSGTRSEVLDRETLSWMKRSGCRSFSYAAESGSPEELKRIKKKVKLPRMLASMREAVKLGLVAKCHLIFGLPDQTKKDVLITFGVIAKMAWVGIHDLGCYAFSPYPGSELYNRLVAEGRIDIESDDYDRVLADNVFTNYKLRRSWTPYLPEWSVRWICLCAMAWFYSLQFLLRPQRLLAMIPNLISKRPETYLQRMLIKKLSFGQRDITTVDSLPTAADGNAVG